jgi:hypothetical protein
VFRLSAEQKVRNCCLTGRTQKPTFKIPEWLFETGNRIFQGNCVRKAEQHYSEQQSPSSQQPIHLMMAG